jgi:hypothetical protein
MMLEKARVLPADEGVDEVFWYLVDGDNLPLFIREEFGDDLPVPVKNLGGKRRLIPSEISADIDVLRRR